MQSPPSEEKASQNFLIVGLGNPGSKYENTRHNMGFLFLDFLAQKIPFSFTEKKGYQIAIHPKSGGGTLYFLKPLEYMNVSGFAVNTIRQYYKILPSHIIVCYDDLAFKFGTLRLKENGGAGGHNGIKSIIEQLGTKEFPHLRFGIDAPPTNIPLEKFVLSSFKKEELKKMNEEILPEAYKILESIFEKGVPNTMSLVNAK